MILVRHGETVFNLHFGASRVDPGVEDPGLTERGIAQARVAADALAASGVRQLVVSPYRRTLETAAVILERLDVPVRIEPLIRERFGFSCDVGTPRSRLRALWPQHAFDHLEERWWGGVAEPEHRLAARCERFRRHMAAQRDWRRVAVITHWGVIRALTGRHLGNGELLRFDPTREPVSVVQGGDPC